MIAQTLPSFLRILTASVETLSGDFCPVMVNLGMVTLVKRSCLGSCPVYYGGSRSSTEGFSQASCGSNIQGSQRISFWCQWGGDDGSVMMIGGGGSGCSRADHAIGITESDHGGFILTHSEEHDF